MNIGIIGCGNISSAYLRLAPVFNNLNIISCADIDPSSAKTQAETFSIRAQSVDAILADASIDLIVNLTVPAAHHDVSRSILQAGKHVYSEKPFVLSHEEGLNLTALADKNKLRIGSAPDTFLGGAHQAARDIIDSGRIGQVIGGSCHFLTHGMESWHPNPDSYYQPGGGPMLDMGAYYLCNLVQLIGPVKRLMSMSCRSSSFRTIGCEPRVGERFPVGTPTTINTLLEFQSGALITLIMSWDVWQHEHNTMELYGSEATLHVPDPNFFGGELKIAKDEEQQLITPNHPFAIDNEESEDGGLRANYRGAGLSDMVAAITQGRTHRCNETLSLHVVDVMTSAMLSAETGKQVDLKSSCERPAALSAKAAIELLA